MLDPTTNEGNVIEVTVLPIGGERKVITLATGSTVQDALSATGYEGGTARVGGVVAGADNILEDGDRLVVTGVTGDKISGGK